MEDWRAKARTTRFVRIDDVWQEVMIKTVGVKKGFNRFGRECYDFPTLRLLDGKIFEDDDILRITSLGFLAELDRVTPEGVGAGIYSIRSEGEKEKTKYFVRFVEGIDTKDIQTRLSV